VRKLREENIVVKKPPHLTASHSHSVSRKREHEFELTLSRSTLNKEHVLDTVQGVTPSALVAAETHDDGAGVHYNSYLHTVDKVKTKELYDSLVGALFFTEET